MLLLILQSDDGLSRLLEIPEALVISNVTQARRSAKDPPMRMGFLSAVLPEKTGD